MEDHEPATVKDWMFLVGILLFACAQMIIIWGFVMEIESGRLHRDLFGPHADCYQCDKARRE